jgi:phosphoribosylformylglycinamidine synthase
LSHNDSGRYEDRWVYLKACGGPCVFVRPGEDAYLPVAHGEGKFLARDAVALDALDRGGQVVFRYVGPDGRADAGYPWNPNGSMGDVAGMCDPTGRIFGLMPHPERHVEGTQHPRWTREGLRPEGDGLRIFRNAVACAQEGLL